MSSHGPQFDEFRRDPSHPHGGAEYDEGFDRLKAVPVGDSSGKGGDDDHGNLHDHLQTTAAHGDRWDEGFREWTPMPLGHGHNFDSNFRAPAALDGSAGHGTWFDVFRGGTQVQAILDGHDVEGTVINARDDHVVVRLRDGRDTELGLQQLRAFRYVEASGAPTRTGIKTAHPGDTPAPQKRSTAEAPSAHSRTAAGGGPRTPVDVEAATSKAPLNKIADELADDEVRKTLDELAALAEQ